MKSAIYLALAFVLALAPAAQAATLLVSPSGSWSWGTSQRTAFTSVGSALAAAVSGDQVWVAEGTYVENLTMKDGVALYGGFAGNETFLDARDPASHPGILDGQAMGPVIYMEGCISLQTVIDGFTIRNGVGAVSPQSGAVFGGGICCWQSSYARISNNVMMGNRAQYGGGIFVNGSYLTVKDNLVKENFATSMGAGIALAANNTSVTGNTIINNRVEYPSIGPGRAGGIFVFGYSNGFLISGNVISGNYGAMQGGGLYMEACSGTVENNTISGNYGSYYGGGINTDTADVTIVNNLFEGNEGGYGGGVAYLGGTGSITGNLFIGNTGAQGGGIYTLNAKTSISNNTLAENQASAGGGAAYFLNGSAFSPIPLPTFTNNIIYSNSSGIAFVGSPQNQPVLSHNALFANTGADHTGVTPGVGDLFADPMLANPAGGDWHLLPGSPCIDGGDNSFVVGTATDFDGDPRILHQTVDIGADEVDPPPVTTIEVSCSDLGQGWCTSDARVSLYAADPDTGVAATKYRINGGVWTVYSGPFFIRDEGVNTVDYYSTDLAGSAETNKSAIVRLDATDPYAVASDPANGATNVPISKTIVVTFNEPIRSGDSFGTILLKAGKKTIAVAASIQGNALYVDPVEALGRGTTYTLILGWHSVKDMAGRQNLQSSLSFTIAKR